MYDHIVVGYDGSKRASRAIDEAGQIATAFGSALHIVAAVSKDELHEFGAGSDRKVMSDVEITKANLATQAKKYEHLDVVTDVVEGKPGPVLVRVAEAVGADAIVVGNKNVQGLSRALGSVAKHVAHNASCTVIVAQTADVVAS